MDCNCVHTEARFKDEGPHLCCRSFRGGDACYELYWNASQGSRRSPSEREIGCRTPLRPQHGRKLWLSRGWCVGPTLLAFARGIRDYIGGRAFMPNVFSHSVRDEPIFT